VSSYDEQTGYHVIVNTSLNFIDTIGEVAGVSVPCCSEQGVKNAISCKYSVVFDIMAMRKLLRCYRRVNFMFDEGLFYTWSIRDY